MFGRRSKPEPLDWNDQYWIEYIQQWRREYGFDASREAIAAAYSPRSAQEEPVTGLFYTPEELRHVMRVQSTRERGPGVDECLSRSEIEQFYVGRDFDASTPTGTWTVAFTDRVDEFQRRLLDRARDPGEIVVKSGPRSDAELQQVYDEVWRREHEIGRRLGAVETDWARGVVNVQVISPDHRHSSLEVARLWGDAVELELVEDDTLWPVSIMRWERGDRPEEIVLHWDGGGLGDADLHVQEFSDRVEVALTIPWKTGDGMAGVGADNRRTVVLTSALGHRDVVDIASDFARAEETGPMNGDRCRVPPPELNAEHCDASTLTLELEDTWTPHQRHFSKIAWFTGHLQPELQTKLVGAFATAFEAGTTDEEREEFSGRLATHDGPFGRLEVLLASVERGPTWNPASYAFVQSGRIDGIVDAMLVAARSDSGSP